MWNRIKKFFKRPVVYYSCMALFSFAVGITLGVIGVYVLPAYFLYFVGGAMLSPFLTGALGNRAVTAWNIEQRLERMLDLRENNEVEEKKSSVVREQKHREATIHFYDITDEELEALINTENAKKKVLNAQIKSMPQPILDRLNTIKQLSVDKGVQLSYQKGVWRLYADSPTAKKFPIILSAIIHKLTEVFAITLENIDKLINILQTNPNDISYLLPIFETIPSELTTQSNVNIVMKNLTEFITIFKRYNKNIQLNISDLLKIASHGYLSNLIEACKKLGENVSQIKWDELISLLEKKCNTQTKIILLLAVSAEEPATRLTNIPIPIPVTQNKQSVDQVEDEKIPNIDTAKSAPLLRKERSSIITDHVSNMCDFLGDANEQRGYNSCNL